MPDQEKGRFRTYLPRNVSKLVLEPLVILSLMAVFQAGQITRYLTSTEGVLYSWIIVGQWFVVIQAQLQWGVWKQSKTSTPEGRFVSRWLSLVQAVTYISISVYNGLAVWLLIRSRAGVHLMDAVLLATAATTIGLSELWLRLRKPPQQARLRRIWRSTGYKIAPQWVQAIALAVMGSRGFNYLSIFALVALALLRVLTAQRNHRAASEGQETSELTDSRALVIINRRDLCSILAMAAGVALGRVGG